MTYTLDIEEIHFLWSSTSELYHRIPGEAVTFVLTM